MSCGEAREKLPLFVGADLDPDALEAVRAHVESCAECGRLSAEATRARRALVAAFRAQEADQARPELWSGIRSVLEAEGLIHAPDATATPSRERRPAGTKAARTSLRGRWTLVLAPAAAAAALLALVQLSGVFFEHGSGKALPNPIGPRAEIAPQVVAVPVSAEVDQATGLVNVHPLKHDVLTPYIMRPRQGGGFAPSSSEISAAGFPPHMK